jgi:hypothetical protein
MSGAEFMYGLADRPIFVGGLMKSGTTLLRVLLGQHPDLFASFESHWYEPEIRDRWADPTSQRMIYLLRLFELDSAEHAALVERKRAEPGREFIDIVLEYCAQRAGKRRWVEKTPGNIRHYTMIRRQWPSAKLVHVTREYRDCYASWKTRQGDSSLEFFLSSALSAYDDIGEILGTNADSYLEVDHSDLVRATEQTMRRILDFTGLEWTPACARLDLAGTLAERKKLIDVLGKDSHTHVSLSRPIFTEEIGQWRSKLSAHEAKRIEQTLAPYYAVLGDRWAR